MGGGNKNMPPQCFKFFRAFAHGLRSKYMEAAKVLIDGPMDRCRLTSKVRRMQATLQPFIARDAELKLYPSITPEDQEGMLAGFTSEVESFGAEMDDMVDNIIPYWRNNYIDQVKCTDNYRAKDWGQYTIQRQNPGTPLSCRESARGHCGVAPSPVGASSKAVRPMQ